MAQATDEIRGIGHSVKRKEDDRFIRGRGTYIDDMQLPGMLHMAILRSPYAHAKINSIDTSRALAHPKVAAVITAKDLETLGLAWMPTISYDTQAVLAGAEPTDEAFAEAGRKAAAIASPVSDVRGPEEYKRHMIEVYVRRGLAQARDAATAA